MSLDVHLTLITKGPHFYFQSTNTPRAPGLCQLLSLILGPKSSFLQYHPPGPGHPQGPSGWAWDTARTIAHPSDYIWTLSGPFSPRPQPCLLPRHSGQALGGCRSSQPIHGHVPSWMPGPRAEEEGQDSFRETESQPLLPLGPEKPSQRKVCFHPPWRLRLQPPLKGACVSHWLQPTSWERAFERAPRPNPSCTEAPS